MIGLSHGGIGKPEAEQPNPATAQALRHPACAYASGGRLSSHELARDDSGEVVGGYGGGCLEMEWAEEVSDEGDLKTKVDGIEHIDRQSVGPVLEKLRGFPQGRMMVLPDQPTNIATRKHGYAPTPFCMA